MKNKKRIFFITAIFLLAVVTAIGLFACNIDDVKEISVTPSEISIRMGEFDFNDYKVTATYDSGKTEEAVLSEEMISAKDRLCFFMEGQHDITVSYLRKTTTIKVNVRRNVFAGATFEDLDVVYTGEFYTVEVKNVPEGTTVTYPTTNRFRNAGEYEVTAILRKDAYEIKEMKAKVTIRKADYDLSSVLFEDKTETFDGNQHVLALEGAIPAGLYVDYTITREGGREELGNSARNAGVYIVQVSFTGDSANYNAITPWEAVLTIEQAAHDVSGVTFENKTEIYDRTRHELAVQGTLPQGVTVSYENNGQVNAGSYEVKAIFTVDDTVNYAPIAPKTAVLTIDKADYDMSSVHFNGTRVTYDGTEKRIELQGTLPIGVSVTYSQNAGVAAGTYRATATFTGTDKNYNNPRPLSADLIIDPAEAEMDKVLFERKRFISRDRSILDQYIDELEDFDEEYIEDYDDEYIDLMNAVKNYNPYTAAMQYLPTNIPVGMTVSSVEYYKTAGWADDLTSFTVHGQGAETAIDENGYYVVVVGFDGHGNYTSITPAKTQIRVDTVNQFPDFNLAVYGENWLDRAANDTVNVYMDYTHGSCSENDRTIQVGSVTLDYCDCNIFQDYHEGGFRAMVNTYDADMPDSTKDAFKYLADKSEVLLRYANAGDVESMNTYGSLLSGFVSYASAASVGPYYYSDPMQMVQDAVAVVGLDHDFANSVNTPLSVDAYRELIAKLFGYASVDAFLSDARGVRNAMLANAARASMDSFADQCAYKGAIYERVTDFYNEQRDLYIMPFKFAWQSENDYARKSFFVYVIFDNARKEQDQYLNRTTVFISDASLAVECINNTPNNSVNVYGRCITSEYPGYRWYPRTRTVISEGKTVKQYVTSGNDSFTFVGAEGTENLSENRSVYKFRMELPGNCTEEMTGYDEAGYTVSAEHATITFCEDDLLSKILRDGGDVSGIAKRELREDHAQFSDDIIAAFDDLSLHFASFFENHTDDDYWRLDVTNRYYGAYREFFDRAQGLYTSANRNLGKTGEYAATDGVIIGLNKAFGILIGGSNVEHSVEEYRTTVMRLFGYDDLETFTLYADRLAQALLANEKNASAEYASTRLLYDGAFYASNGYFVLPYAFESDLIERRVLSFLFVDNDGNMAIWLNHAADADAAVAFRADGERTAIDVIGRCELFEDDAFIMIDNIDSAFVEIVENLRGYNPFAPRDVSEDEMPIAVESIRNITGVGNFIVYTEPVDSEGFIVCLSSVYEYETEPQVLSGFYTLITVVSLDDVKECNRRERESALIDPFNSYQGDETSTGEGD